VTYLSEVIADNPLHYWRCADPPGSVLNDIGSSPLQMLRTNGSGADTGYSGPVSDGGSVRGDMGMQLADSDLSLTTPFTFECWAWQDYSAGVAQAVMETNNGGGFVVGLAISAGLVLQAFTATGPINDPTTYTKDHWHHLVLTHTAATAILYRDGANVGSRAAAAVAQTLSLAVGCRPALPVQQILAGFVSEAAWYTSALSAARVLAHFNAADQITQPPVATGGSLSGSSTNVNYTGLLQQILQSVRKLY